MTCILSIYNDFAKLELLSCLRSYDPTANIDWQGKCYKSEIMSKAHLLITLGGTRCMYQTNLQHTDIITPQRAGFWTTRRWTRPRRPVSLMRRKGLSGAAEGRKDPAGWKRHKDVWIFIVLYYLFPPILYRPKNFRGIL